MILREIAFYLILGKPVLMYLGIITFLSFLFTALVAILNMDLNIHTIPFKWHRRMAAISISLAFAHALLGFSTYVNLF